MILSVQNLTFNYNSHPVLKDVCFHVETGELLAILGPNGVGKTTLLKCINGIHAPREGVVYVGGSDVLQLSPPEIAKEVGYVAQRSETARLTVFDAVLMGRKPHLRWRVERNDLKIVEAAIRRLGLEHLTLRHIDQLSGGELQKVSIARALVQEPRLMLLDEPTSSLDLKNQVAILALLRNVVEEHRIAAVMTMHDLNTALRYAHKFIFLKNGAVFSMGRTQEVSPDMVEEVYGLPVELHHLNGSPVVVPVCDQAPRDDYRLDEKEKLCPAPSRKNVSKTLSHFTDTAARG